MIHVPRENMKCKDKSKVIICTIVFSVNNVNVISTATTSPVLYGLVEQFHAAINVHNFSIAEVDNCHAMEKNVGNDDKVFTQCKQRVHCQQK